jgi:hypothetical protein
VVISALGYGKKTIYISDLRKQEPIFLTAVVEYIENVTVTEKQNFREQIRVSRLSNMPKGLYGFGMAIAQDSIYVHGGDLSRSWDDFKHFLREDPRVANLSEAQSPMALIRLMRQVNNFYAYEKGLFRYNINEDSWNKIEIELKPRAYHNLWFDHIQNKLLVIGGKSISTNGKQEFLNHTIEQIDVLKGKVQVDEMNPHMAANAGLASVADGFLVMGGSIKKDNHDRKIHTDLIHAYSTKNGNWYTIDTLKEALEPVVTIIGNTLYMIGDKGRNGFTTLWSYHLKTKSWISEGKLFNPWDSISIASDKTTLYLYHYGKVVSFDTHTKILKQYAIPIYTRNPKMGYHRGALYLLGGYSLESGMILPSDRCYKVDVSEFKRTKVMQSKKFSGPNEL